jgi:hypothetical protein
VGVHGFELDRLLSDALTYQPIMSMISCMCDVGGLRLAGTAHLQQQQRTAAGALQQQVLSAVAACTQACREALEQLQPAAAQLQEQDAAVRYAHMRIHVRAFMYKPASPPNTATSCSNPA